MLTILPNVGNLRFCAEIVNFEFFLRALKRAAAKQNAFHVEPLQIRGDHGMKNSNQEAFRTKLNGLRERTPGNFVISVDIVNT